MAKQFIAHAEAPKTFAHAKGAKAAIKRDLAKHFKTHGDTLYDTGFDVKKSGERFGVIVYLDLTPKHAKKLVGPELAGYVIQPELEEEPVKKPVAKKTASKPVDDKKSQRRNNEVTITPNGSALIPARYGSTQQKIIDLLARDGGASLDQLVESCVRKDGKNWSPASLMAGLYHHIPYKGYGVRTTFVGDVAHYHVVFPKGCDAPAAPRRPRAIQNLLDKVRGFLTERNTPQSLQVNALTDAALLSKFKNFTEVKEYVAKLEAI